jgi:hypothetical protein
MQVNACIHITFFVVKAGGCKTHFRANTYLCLGLFAKWKNAKGTNCPSHKRSFHIEKIWAAKESNKTLRPK